MKSNNPPITVVLTSEQVQFILENCAANIKVGMNTLAKTHSGSGDDPNLLSDIRKQHILELNRKFKDLEDVIKRAVEAAQF